MNAVNAGTDLDRQTGCKELYTEAKRVSYTIKRSRAAGHKLRVYRSGAWFLVPDDLVPIGGDFKTGKEL